MEKTLGIFHNNYSSPRPGHKGIFLRSLLWEPGGIGHLLCPSLPPTHPETVAPTYANLHSNSNNSPKLWSKYSYLFMAPAASALDRQILAVSVWICLFFQISGWQFALQTQFSHGSKKCNWFHFVQLFCCCCRMRVTLSKLSMCQRWTGNLLIKILI